MDQRQKSNYINASIVVGIISILLTVLINYQIAKEYLRVDGKTRLWFGLVEVRFFYQYFVVLLGLLSLFLAIWDRKTNTQKNKFIVAILLSLFSISVVFLKIWRLFI